MPENEVDPRKIIDLWDGPIVRPSNADSPQDPTDVTAESEPIPEPETRAIGSTTLNSSRGWSGGWSD